MLPLHPKLGGRARGGGGHVFTLSYSPQSAEGDQGMLPLHPKLGGRSRGGGGHIFPLPYFGRGGGCYSEWGEGGGGVLQLVVGGMSF